MLEEKNVKFYMNNEVKEIRGENGKVILVSDRWQICSLRNVSYNAPM